LLEGERSTDDRDKLYQVTRQDTYKALGEAVMGYTPVRIWDRLYFSELAYAEPMGRAVQFLPDERAFVEGVLLGAQIPIVICLPSLIEVRANMANQAKHQLAVAREQTKAIYMTYSTIASQLKSRTFNCHTFNYELDELAFIHRVVEEYLSRRKLRTWH
jgi:hypothetical protein